MFSVKKEVLGLPFRKIIIIFSLILTYNLGLAQSSDSLAYFPCDLGDTWIYTVYTSLYESEYVRIQIDSTFSHPLGKRLHMTTWDGYRSAWLIVDTAKAIIYESYFNQIDSTWPLLDRYHLNAQTGDYWLRDSIYSPNYGWYGVYAIIDTGVFWGPRKIKIFENIFGFYHGDSVGLPDTSGGRDHNPINWHSAFSEDYAYGIGLTYRISQAEGWFLIGAILHGDTMGTIVHVKEEKKSVPDQFALFQNYPNPFNPSTAISYQLLSYDHVTLKLFDVLGREVKILVNANETAGQHVVRWDGTDQRGYHVPSGVYYYRLTTSHGSITKKTILIR